MKPGRPIIHVTPMESERIRIPSLEALEEFHVNNSKVMQKIQVHSTINRIALVSLFITAILISILLHLMIRKMGRKVILQLNQKETCTKNNARLINMQRLENQNLLFISIPFFYKFTRGQV